MQRSSETLWSCPSGKVEIWDHHHRNTQAVFSITAKREMVGHSQKTEEWRGVVKKKKKWYISTV